MHMRRIEAQHRPHGSDVVSAEVASDSVWRQVFTPTVSLDFSREVLTKGRIPTPKHMYQDMFWRERKRPLL
jgi:hypothetical protein